MSRKLDTCLFEVGERRETPPAGFFWTGCPKCWLPVVISTAERLPDECDGCRLDAMLVKNTALHARIGEFENRLRTPTEPPRGRAAEPNTRERMASVGEEKTLGTAVPERESEIPKQTEAARGASSNPKDTTTERRPGLQKDGSGLPPHQAVTESLSGRDPGRREGEPYVGSPQRSSEALHGACGSSLTDRGDEHRTSSCMLVGGHPYGHYDPRTETHWTNEDYDPDAAIPRTKEPLSESIESRVERFVAEHPHLAGNEHAIGALLREHPRTNDACIVEPGADLCGVCDRDTNGCAIFHDTPQPVSDDALDARFWVLNETLTWLAANGHKAAADALYARDRVYLLAQRSETPKVSSTCEEAAAFIRRVATDWNIPFPCSLLDRLDAVVTGSAPRPEDLEEANRLAVDYPPVEPRKRTS